MFDLQNSLPFILILISTVILLGYVLYLNQKVAKLLAGGLGKNLPEALAALKKQAEEQETFKKEIVTYLKAAEQRILRSTQAVGLVRFNPFRDSGNGGQSFAAAFIDEKGNGLIISSLYVRDSVSVYAKPLELFKSTFELTAEETEAVEKAKAMLPLSKN